MRALAVLVLVAIIAAPVLAGEGVFSEPPVFAAVPDPGASVRPSVPLAVIVDPGVPAVQPTRPVVIQPEPTARVALRDPGGHVSVDRSVARGVASWYCGNGSPCTRGYPGGLHAAAGPALRVGDWRGRIVVVSANGRSVRVRLSDWCACYGSRVIDLYTDVWAALGVPLSRGLVKVEVRW